LCGRGLAVSGGTSLDRRARLRERLMELRDYALGRMLRRCAVEPGHLPMIAGIAAALDALDTIPVEAEMAARAVVSDDGRETRLTLYAEAGAAAAIVLDPIRAVTLAGRLLAAALPRLSSPSCNGQPSDGPGTALRAARGRATAASWARRYPSRGKC
jgi:hypothetical protein